MWTSRAVSAALLVVALASAAARADDPPKSAPAPGPDTGFLEFLGGVDGLAELNPDYLAQAGTTRPAVPPAKPPSNPPPPAPAPGAKSNE
jgi:hypothetical protein